MFAMIWPFMHAESSPFARSDLELTQNVARVSCQVAQDVWWCYKSLPTRARVGITVCLGTVRPRISQC